MVVKDQKTKKPINLFFITKGYGNGKQFYTDAFRRSELYDAYKKDIVLPEYYVEFIRDSRWNWFELDTNRPQILPPIPKDILVRSYKFSEIWRLGMQQMASDALKGVRD